MRQWGFVLFVLFFLAGCGGGGGGGGSESQPDETPDDPVENQEEAVKEPLTFLNPGPVKLLVGHSYNNPVQGGKANSVVTFQSDNESVATVSHSGVVNIVGSGSAVITATQENDTDADLISTSYQIESIERTFDIGMWVGADKTEVVFPAGVEGLNFYSSRDESCDLEYYPQCADSIFSLLNGESVIDYALNLDQPSRYSFRFGEFGAQQTINLRDEGVSYGYHETVSFQNRFWMYRAYGWRDEAASLWVSDNAVNWSRVQTSVDLPSRIGSTLIVFKNQLWLIGGTDPTFAEEHNDVWSSEDGITWTRVTENAAFSERSYHEMVEFAGKLWLIGGVKKIYGGSEKFNDVWFSSDGLAWQEATSNAGFAPRSGHAVVVFQERLWVMGGSGNVDVNPLADVWASSDGIVWEQKQTDGSFMPVQLHQVVEFEGKLWLVGGDNLGVNNIVRVSANGYEWTVAQSQASFSRRMSHNVLLHNGRLYLVGGTEPSAAGTHTIIDSYYSENAVDWFPLREHSTLPNIKKILVPFKGKLFSFQDYKNQIHSTEDGLNWTLIASLPEYYHHDTASARSGFVPVAFHDRLWVIGGEDGWDNYDNDIWVSDDGRSWVLALDNAPFKPRVGHKVVEFQNRLWLYGGTDQYDHFINDIWYSDDGISWHQAISTTPHPLVTGHLVVEFNGKLWLLGGMLPDARTNDRIYMSEDGVNWQHAGSRPSYYFVSQESTVAEFNNKLWLILAGQRNEVWVSENGFTWTLPDEDPGFSLGLYPSLAPLGGNMYYVHFVYESRTLLHNLWKSDDMQNWKAGLKMPVPLH